MEMLERLWEGTGLFFSGLMQSFERGVTSIFGTSNSHVVRRMLVRVARINALEEKLSQLSNDELREQTAKFKQRLRDGESLDDILEEAFAVCREAGKRYLKMRHYDVQLIGGMVLHSGSIAEMVTGEGKTLVATLPAYLNAIEGRGVHVITVNDYLARRDMEWMAPLYMGLGLTVGNIQSGMETAERQKSYACDITYGTNNEFGFDYLRDNMRPAARDDNRFPKHMQQVQGPLNYAIIDEVDNILIDEARTPLIISGPAELDLGKYIDADRIARGLVSGKHFTVNEKDHNVSLTDEGVRAAERLAGVESFYTAGNMEWPHLIDNALKAHYLYKRDVNYVVRDNAITIVDEFTGRLMEGRQWSDGLHQAVEAKEGVKIKEETQTLATITLQNFFKLYRKISGMTGTAMTEATEFVKIYGLDVVAIPTNRTMQRIEHPDAIFLSEREKFNAVADDVERVHKFDILLLKDRKEVLGEIVKETESEITIIPSESKEKSTYAKDQIEKIEYKGRPILIGTVSIEKSEVLSKLLDRRGIRHQVLNAKHHKREADIIAQAGRRFAVTIATNMAGRGTDIILGGNAETMAWAQLQDQYPTRLEVPKETWETLVKEIETRDNMKAEGQAIKELGGLYVVGTERHESRRIDLQLRGRCGRQGDTGSSRFFLSLEDDLMRIFAGDWVRTWMSKMGMQEGERIESNFVSRRIAAAQKKVEERNFEIRKNLLEYDEVMDQQRKRIYGYRQRILAGLSCRDLVLEQIKQQITHHVSQFLDPMFGPDSFAKWAGGKLHCKLEGRDYRGQDGEAASAYAHEVAERAAETAILDAIDENMPREDDADDWNLEALSNWYKARYGTVYTPQQLKKISRDKVDEELIEKAREQLAKIDLTEGHAYLESAYGLNMALTWFKGKFGLDADAESLKGVESNEVVQRLIKRAFEAYENKEIYYPVVGALQSFSQQIGPNEYSVNREALAAWAGQRFQSTELSKMILEDDGNKVFDALAEANKNMLAKASVTNDAIDQHVDELFRGLGREKSVKAARAENRAAFDKLMQWSATELNDTLGEDEVLRWNREDLELRLRRNIDDKFYPEVRRMERSLLLNIVDESWKNHLLAMDHLRSAVGLKGYAQIDPKVEYKREGMRLYDQMWFSIGERMTDLVFRVETLDMGPIRSSMVETQARHEEAPRIQAQQVQLSKEQEVQAKAIADSDEPVRVDPIRKIQSRVGRNDPCPCGSGKKYKNCCLKNETVA
ncbi:MAG: SEC-C domain-containing protein [Planctomycetes bacterium]|nr:SEC-C domain-containing protein [Planctomycetota bacterium]